MSIPVAQADAGARVNMRDGTHACVRDNMRVGPFSIRDDPPAVTAARGS